MALDLRDLLGKEFELNGRGPEKFDCFGLAQEVLRRAGKDVPDEITPNEGLLALHTAVAQGKRKYYQIAKPEPFCIVTFKIRPPYITHVGVVLENKQEFIHIMRKSRVTIERIYSLMWLKRVDAFYDYRA